MPNGVLRNRLGITDAHLLARAEADITRARLIALTEHPLWDRLRLSAHNTADSSESGSVYWWLPPLNGIPNAGQAWSSRSYLHHVRHAYVLHSSGRPVSPVVATPAGQLEEDAAKVLAGVRRLRIGDRDRGLPSRRQSESRWASSRRSPTGVR